MKNTALLSMILIAIVLIVGVSFLIWDSSYETTQIEEEGEPTEGMVEKQKEYISLDDKGPKERFSLPENTRNVLERFNMSVWYLVRISELEESRDRWKTLYDEIEERNRMNEELMEALGSFLYAMGGSLDV